MSRHTRWFEGHEVVVGWDPPLQTFFGQVHDPDAHEDAGPHVWVGADPGVRLLTVDALREALGAPWQAVLDEPKLVFALELDQEANLA